jgi:hypothetical protein
MGLARAADAFILSLLPLASEGKEGQAVFMVLDPG